MLKHDIQALDAGQLDLMWNFLKLQKKNTCTKQDVQNLKDHLDKIRQGLIQKDAGQRKEHPDNVDFGDLGTYINLVVLDALSLYIYGGLDVLENALENDALME